MKRSLKLIVASLTALVLPVFGWSADIWAQWKDFSGLTAETSLAPDVSGTFGNQNAATWTFNLGSGSVGNKVVTIGAGAPSFVYFNGSLFDVGREANPTSILLEVELPIEANADQNKPLAHIGNGATGYGFCLSNSTTVKGTWNNAYWNNNNNAGMSVADLDTTETTTIWLALLPATSNSVTTTTVAINEDGTVTEKMISGLHGTGINASHIYLGNYGNGTENGLQYKLKSLTVYYGRATVDELKNTITDLATPYNATIDQAEIDYSALSWTFNGESTTPPSDLDGALINVSTDAKLTVDSETAVKILKIAGSGALTISGESLTAEETFINTDTDVSDVTSASLGEVTVASGKTLTVKYDATAPQYTSLTAPTGSLRVANDVALSNLSELNAAGSWIVGSGTITKFPTESRASDGIATSSVVVENGATLDINGSYDTKTSGGIVLKDGAKLTSSVALLNDVADDKNILSKLQLQNISLEENANATILGDHAIGSVVSNHGTNPFGLNKGTLTVNLNGKDFLLANGVIDEGTIVLQNGTLNFRKGLSASPTTVRVEGGNINIADADASIGSLNGGVSGTMVWLNSKTLTLGANDADSTFTGSIRNGKVKKVGAGTLAFSPADATNPAQIEVDAGTLKLSAEKSYANSITLNAGVTLDVSAGIPTVVGTLTLPTAPAGFAVKIAAESMPTDVNDTAVILNASVTGEIFAVLTDGTNHCYAQLETIDGQVVATRLSNVLTEDTEISVSTSTTLSEALKGAQIDPTVSRALTITFTEPDQTFTFDSAMNLSFSSITVNGEAGTIESTGAGSITSTATSINTAVDVSGTAIALGTTTITDGSALTVDNGAIPSALSGTGTLVLNISDSITPSAADLEKLRAYTGTVIFKSADAAKGATLNHSNGRGTLDTCSLKSQYVFDGGTHVLTYGVTANSGDAGFAINRDYPDANPAVWVKNGASVTWHTADLSGWHGTMLKKQVIRVEDASLTFADRNGTEFFRNRLLLGDKASVTIAADKFHVYGGVGTSAADAQIAMVASDAEAPATATISGSLQSGGYSGNYASSSDANRGMGIAVGTNSTLDVQKLLGDKPIVKYGAGTLLLSGTENAVNTTTMTVTEGTLKITGSLDATITIKGGAAIAGNGTLSGALVLEDGAIIDTTAGMVTATDTVTLPEAGAIIVRVAENQMPEEAASVTVLPGLTVEGEYKAFIMDGVDTYSATLSTVDGNLVATRPSTTGYASFGVNFMCDASEVPSHTVAEETDVGFAKNEYVVPETWVDITGSNSGSQTIQDIYTIQWTARGNYRVSAPASTTLENANQKLLYGYLDDQNANNDSNPTVTITGLPDDKQYAVALILSGDAKDTDTDKNAYFAPVVINEETYSYNDASELLVGSASATRWGSRKASAATTLVEGMNVMFVEGLSGSTLSIASMTSDPKDSRLTIAGVQVWITNEDVPPPVTLNGREVISLNFNSAENSYAGSVGEAAAGLCKVGGWNNLTGASGSGTSLRAWNGISAVEAPMVYSFASKETWGYSTNVTDAFLKGYLDDGDHDGVTGATITIPAVPFDEYSVIVYVATDTPNAKFRPVQINGTWYAGSATTTNYGYANVVQNSATWGASRSSTAVYGTNAIRVDGLSGNLTIQGSGKDGDNRGGIAAVQIINTSDSAWLETPVWTPTVDNQNWNDISLWSHTQSVPTSGTAIIDASAVTRDVSVTVPSQFDLLDVRGPDSAVANVSFSDGAAASIILLSGRVAAPHAALTSSSSRIIPEADATVIHIVDSDVTWDANVTNLYNFGKKGNGTLTLTTSLSGSKPVYIFDGTLKLNGQANGNYGGTYTIDQDAILAAIGNNYNPIGGSSSRIVNNGLLQYLSGTGGHFDGVMSGYGKVQVAGGEFSLAGTNTYSGGTEVATGATLVLSNASALGTGKVTGAGTVRVKHGSHPGVDNAKQYGFNEEAWAGTVAFVKNGDSGTFNVGVLFDDWMNAGSTFVVDTGVTIKPHAGTNGTVAGTLSGTGSIGATGELANITFADGAKIDATGATSEAYLDITGDVTANGKVVVTNVTDSMLGHPVVTYTGTGPENPTTTFVSDKAYYTVAATISNMTSISFAKVAVPADITVTETELIAADQAVKAKQPNAVVSEITNPEVASVITGAGVTLKDKDDGTSSATFTYTFGVSEMAIVTIGTEKYVVFKAELGNGLNFADGVTVSLEGAADATEVTDITGKNEGSASDAKIRYFRTSLPASGGLKVKAKATK